MTSTGSLLICFSAFQYNTTVKPSVTPTFLQGCFSAFQYNTTVKPCAVFSNIKLSFSAFQYNTTVKRLEDYEA